MRQPDNRRDVELFEEVFSDPSRAGDAVSWSLTINGQPIDDPKPTSLVGFSEEANPAWALSGTTITPLNHRWKRKPVRLDLRVEGRLWREFRGRLQMIGENEDTSGSFGAATSGYYQGGGDRDGVNDAIKFNVFPGKEYNGTPSAAYRDMLARIPYRRRMIPNIVGPDFVRTGENKYPPSTAVGEAIDELEEESGTIQLDRPLDWAAVIPRPKIGGVAIRKDARNWRVGREVSTFSAQTASEAEFYDVGILRLLSNGIYESLVNPRPKIRYPAGVEPPPVNSTYWEEITDESTTRTGDARTRALVLTTVLRYGEFDVSMGLDFIDPRIEDYDVREVLAQHPETEEEYLYRVLITSQERNYTEMTMRLDGKGVIIGRAEGGADS